MKTCFFWPLIIACGLVTVAEKSNAEEKSAVETLLDVMRYEEMTIDSAAAVFDGTIDQFKQQGVPAEAITEIRNESRALFVRIFSNPVMRKKTADLYTKHFTDQEIVEMTEFYRTQLGQKTLVAMPAIMKDAMNLAMPLVQREMAGFQEKVSDIVQKHEKAATDENDEAGAGDKNGGE